MTRIIETENCVGMCYSNKNERFIEINKHLKDYDKELYKSVLNHELEHLNSNNRFDVMIELKDLIKVKKSLKLLKFMLKYPKSLRDHFPIIVKNRKFCYDSFQIAFLSSFIILNVGIISLIF